jgi:hypothetical protein
MLRFTNGCQTVGFGWRWISSAHLHERLELCGRGVQHLDELREVGVGDDGCHGQPMKRRLQRLLMRRQRAIALHRTSHAHACPRVMNVRAVASASPPAHDVIHGSQAAGMGAGEQRACVSVGVAVTVQRGCVLTAHQKPLQTVLHRLTVTPVVTHAHLR